MRLLYIDTANNQLVSDSGFRTPVRNLQFKRGDDATIGLEFINGSTTLSAVSGAQIVFGLKQQGDYDGTYVVAASATSYSGNDYIMAPSFNTQQLNTLLGSDGLSGNDVAAVTLMGEITWSFDNVLWSSTDTFTVTVNNDVNKSPYIFPFEFTPAAPLIRSTAPENGSMLSATSAGITYTLHSGVSAANITIYQQTSAATVFNVASPNISAITGTKCNMIVSGNLSSFDGDYHQDMTGTYKYVGDLIGDYPTWTINGEALTDGEYVNTAVILKFPTYFILQRQVHGVTTYETTSLTNSSWPDGLLYDTPSSGEGIPTIVASGTTGAQLVSSMTASPQVSALVRCVGTSTDVISAQTVQIPYIGTFGYVSQDCIVNQEDVYKCVQSTPISKWTKLN